MAEKSSDIIKFLFNMKVIATINHNIDKDTAEYIVKEFGHKPILEEKPIIDLENKKDTIKGDLKKDLQLLLLWDTWITERHLCWTH